MKINLRTPVSILLPTILIRRHFDYRAGTECHYIDVSPTIAVKLYNTFREREIAYQSQKLAAHHKLAPPVGKVFTLPSGSFAFGYTTRVAKMEYVVRWQKRAILCESLRELGIGANDIHAGNMGIYNRKLVWIDFGSQSNSGSKPRKIAKNLARIAA